MTPFSNSQQPSQPPASYDEHQSGDIGASILSTPQDKLPKRKRQRKRSDLQEGGSIIKMYENEGNITTYEATAAPADETPRPQKRLTFDVSFDAMVPYIQNRPEFSPSPSRASASDAPSSVRSHSFVKKAVVRE